MIEYIPDDSDMLTETQLWKLTVHDGYSLKDHLEDIVLNDVVYRRVK